MKEVSWRLSWTSSMEYPLIYHIYVHNPEHDRKARLSLYECTGGREPCLLTYSEQNLEGDLTDRFNDLFEIYSNARAALDFILAKYGLVLDYETNNMLIVDAGKNPGCGENIRN